MIKFKISAKRLPQSGDEGTTVKYCPQIVPTSVETLDQIVKRISNRTTITSSDVRAVIDALEYEIIEVLQRGDSVRLEKIGSFRPTISARCVDTAAEAKSKGVSLIKKVNVIFTKSVDMSSAMELSNLEFSAAQDLINATDPTDDESE